MKRPVLALVALCCLYASSHLLAATDRAAAQGAAAETVPISVIETDPEMQQILESDRDYVRIRRSLRGLGRTNITLDLAKCYVAGERTPGPGLRGGFSFAEYMIDEQQRIRLSTTHHMVSDGKAAVAEFLRIEIPPGGLATVSMSAVSMPDYRVTASKRFECTLGEGLTVR
ncbi:VirK family protein [Arenibaculum pallidiluteum]|uniref:VirK family protein n=1 Tax=Arenibaculum pallidiluteum TaxID=2812559 RepID=UPI001A972511|nr:VirK family protein [Arenibaculum pallidiluteum]